VARGQIAAEVEPPAIEEDVKGTSRGSWSRTASLNSTSRHQTANRSAGECASINRVFK
jgi:hypothetical protein